MKHRHYQVLNLLGYGLAKFDKSFIQAFGCETKTAFYQKMVDDGIAETTGVVKNRMDLFDPFFDNGRKGWWQRKEAYHHRKLLIDNLFGQEDVDSYAEMVKLYLNECGLGIESSAPIKPIVRSRFKQLQKTGLEAELYFMQHYQNTELFKGASLLDARLYGDGYDFQLTTKNQDYLAEVKGIRQERGRLRLTQREFEQADYYGNRYVLSVVTNLEESPKLWLVQNPLKVLTLIEKTHQPRAVKEYHLEDFSYFR